MADAKRITDFLRSRVGNLGISSLVLVVLERILDNDFVCPCQPGYNEGICACYALIPFVVFFIFSFCFVDPKLEDRGMMGKSTCGKILYSLLIASIWLFLFFFDGEYVACACSRWGGEYTETGSFKWCKPTGNETMLEIQQKTQRCITTSEFAGFGVVVLIAIILGVSRYCRYKEQSVQQNGDVSLSNRNNG